MSWHEGGMAPPAVTPRMLTALNTLLGAKHGLTGPARLEWLTDRFGREVGSTKDLGFDEVSGLIDELGDLPDHTEEQP